MIGTHTSETPARSAIRLRGVRRRYGTFEALRGIDLDIPAGALCGLIGPNGAGKTTLLSILATLDEDFTGEVFLDGINLRDNPGDVRARIGFVPDHTAIYDALTVPEFLLFFAAAAGLPTHLRDAAVDDVIARCGLETLRTRPAGGLSKGLTQRLCVARALLHKPAILLLDEPASGLDPRARIELKELLKKLAAEGVTVLISSHILTELGDFCDHIVIVERGQLKAADRVDALFAAAHGRSASALQRRLTVEVVGDVNTARATALACPHVSACHTDGQLLAVTITSSPEASAMLVAALVGAGVGVAAVVPERLNLEALFLTMTQDGVA